MIANLSQKIFIMAKSSWRRRDDATSTSLPDNLRARVPPVRASNPRSTFRVAQAQRVIADDIPDVIYWGWLERVRPMPLLRSAL
jgi:hypothetical protein